MAYKLGRKSPDYSQPRLWAEDYYHYGQLPDFQQKIDYWSAVRNWPMYLNDQIGDCTLAGACHSIGAWTQYAQGNEAVFSDSIPLQAYESVGGYVPGNSQTDGGCTLQSVLQYWQTTGFDGHKIQAFAQLREVNEATLNTALYLFGSVYLGLNLPESAEQQFGQQPWTYVKGSQIVGGHCVVLQGFQNNIWGDYTVITWGAVQRVTLPFMRTYCEEAWVALSPDWITANGDTITGLDIQELTADMNLVA